MKQSTFPPEWDEKRVRKVLAHYEEETCAPPAAPNQQKLWAGRGRMVTQINCHEGRSLNGSRGREGFS